ncbi:MAG: hypothetical protein OZSIB_1125 [Candidatus Ozemobacter sibiricus]|jgi:predicted Zn-dependent protease|uniref:Uncharacterized protein n=1 Tax=Candidatus Ozemobacter sibiricus TaxID=2268124 RepID=A0A367ZN14_9BACT|nr:MAG: hypothetical protein OZSIB_1125 [Candidatus Ozemobacter sibiricus]
MANHRSSAMVHPASLGVAGRRRRSPWAVAAGAILVLVMMGLAGLGGPRLAGAAPDPRYAKALELLKKKNYPEGVKEYYKFIILGDPSLSAEVRKADLAPAYAHFSERLAKEPNDSRARFFLALIDRCVHRLQQAGTNVDQVRNRHPKSNLLTFVKGEICLVQEMMAEASQLFLRLKEHSQGQKLWKVAAFLMKRNGVEASALERKAALLKKAYRHIDLMERESAESLLATIIKEFPEDPEPVRALVDLYLEWKRFDQAQRVVDAWRAAQGRSPLLPIQEGRLAYQLGRYADAIKALEPLLKREPGNEYAAMFLAESYFQMGNYVAATNLYRTLADQDPGNVALTIRLAACLECSGKAGEAAAVLEAAVGRQPKDLLLQLELGGMLERSGKLVDAAGWYRRVAFEPGPLQAMANERLNAIYRRTVEENGVAAPASLTASPGPGAGAGADGQSAGSAGSGAAVGADRPGQIADVPEIPASERTAAVRDHQSQLNRDLSNVFR